MLEHLQGQQDTDGNGPSAALGWLREPWGDTLFEGIDQSWPGESIGPLTDGMALGHNVDDLSRCSGTSQPMLQVANKAHLGLS